METLNPLFQHIIGQRTGLSFLDAKAINLAYCQGKHLIYALRCLCFFLVCIVSIFK